jgi:catechol 2,3-dioxygenase-like lactoylglutathione lyase family enzyme
MKGYLQEIHPTLPVKDVKKALDFYVIKLGFSIAFADDSSQASYAGVKRDNVEIHLQWHDPKEWAAVDRPMLRFLTQNIETLFDEYKTNEVFHKNTSLKDTSWSTREFAFYDLYQNGLTFYQNL